jgi:autotransporter-associated beta strand protein
MPADQTRHPILNPISAAVLALVLASAAMPASATPFLVSGAITTGQTLDANEKGTVAAGGNLAVGGSTVAVAIKGDNAVLDNQGTIRQTGSGRAIRDNAGARNLTITNGGSANGNAAIRTADADVIQMNVPKASVVLNNYGALVSDNASRGGAQAVDFAAVTGANTVNNYAGGLLAASEADAVRPGANGVVNNAGTIRSTAATGGGSDGIDGQENSGIQVNNKATGVVDGGRHGITAGQASAAASFTIGVANDKGGIIRGNDGAGINIDGVNGKQTATVVNHGTIVGNGVSGDGDGVDVDGLVNIVNTGTIRSSNATSAPGSGMAYSEGISAGGGTIVNAGTIEGLVAPGNKNAVGRGIIMAGNDIAGAPGSREGLYGNAVITNQAGGTIRGQSDSAIVAEGAASGYTVTIENNAGGRIVGGGTAAAIRTGADRTVIVNAGIIDGSSSGKAIALGSAKGNTVIVSGGAARIVGGIDGGQGGSNTVVLDAGKGNAFAYAGALTGALGLEVKSGTATLSGKSSYDGATTLRGGTLALDGSNRLGADSALLLAGGTLDLSAAGSGTQTFGDLSLLDDSTILLGDGTLTFSGLGTVMAGKALRLLDAQASKDAALRFAGNHVNDPAFRELMRATSIDKLHVHYAFDGTYTNVLLNAVPEPGSLALLLAGIGMLGAARRRKRG